jgi:hypothetical protein
MNGKCIFLISALHANISSRQFISKLFFQDAIIIFVKEIWCTESVMVSNNNYTNKTNCGVGICQTKS